MHSPESPRYVLVRQCLWLAIDMLDEVMARDSASPIEMDRMLDVRGSILDQLHRINNLEKRRRAPSPAA